MEEWTNRSTSFSCPWDEILFVVLHIAMESKYAQCAGHEDWTIKIKFYLHRCQYTNPPLYRFSGRINESRGGICCIADIVVIRYILTFRSVLTSFRSLPRGRGRYSDGPPSFFFVHTSSRYDCYTPLKMNHPKINFSKGHNRTQKECTTRHTVNCK